MHFLKKPRHDLTWGFILWLGWKSTAEDGSSCVGLAAWLTDERLWDGVLCNYFCTVCYLPCLALGFAIFLPLLWIFHWMWPEQSSRLMQKMFAKFSHVIICCLSVELTFQNVRWAVKAQSFLVHLFFLLNVISDDQIFIARITYFEICRVQYFNVL